MKTLDKENFEGFVLSDEEMMNIRGGNGGMVLATGDPTKPPIIIEI